MLSFNILVKRLWKQSWKILLKEDVFELIDPEKKKKYQSFIDKAIYKLKIEKKIIPLKSWIYIVPEPEDLHLNEIDLVEKYYFKLLKRYLVYFVWSEYYISGKKSLEFHLKDFSIPEKISIVNRKLNKRIKIGNYEIIFKTVTWKVGEKKTNLFARLYEYSQNIYLDNLPFKAANLELALVESAIIGVWEQWVDIELLSKTIKKYSKFLKKDILYTLWEYKFIMSFNRLKELSKNIDDEFYRLCLDIVKKNGGLFIWEWLRGF